MRELIFLLVTSRSDFLPYSLLITTSVTWKIAVSLIPQSTIIISHFTEGFEKLRRIMNNHVSSFCKLDALLPILCICWTCLIRDNPVICLSHFD